MVIVAQGCAAVNAIDDWDNPPRKEGETMHLGAGPGPTSVCGLFPTHALELTQQFSFLSNENLCICRTVEHRPETDGFSKHSGVGIAPSSGDAIVAILHSVLMLHGLLKTKRLQLATRPMLSYL